MCVILFESEYIFKKVKITNKEYINLMKKLLKLRIQLVAALHCYDLLFRIHQCPLLKKQ